MLLIAVLMYLLVCSFIYLCILFDPILYVRLVLPACMIVNILNPDVCECQERASDHPGNGVPEDCKLPCGCWE